MIEGILALLAASGRAGPWPVVVLFLAAAAAVGLGPILAGRVLRPRRPTFVKTSPYECGIDPVGDACGPFPIRYYAVAVAFLLFDVEAALLYPWAVAYGEGSAYLLVGFLVFGGVLAVGYLWAWRRGGIDWA